VSTQLSGGLRTLQKEERLNGRSQRETTPRVEPSTRPSGPTEVQTWQRLSGNGDTGSRRQAGLGSSESTIHYRQRKEWPFGVIWRARARRTFPRRSGGDRDLPMRSSEPAAAQRARDDLQTVSGRRGPGIAREILRGRAARPCLDTEVVAPTRADEAG